MRVKCINNKGANKRLVENEIYIVKLKKHLSWNMTLVGKSGIYDITRFVKMDGSWIKQRDIIVNKQYYFNKKIINEYEYIKLKQKKRLKTLMNDTYYKIDDFSFDNNGHPYVNSAGIPFSYNINNFTLYTKDEFKNIKRKEKIIDIKYNLKQKVKNSV